MWPTANLPATALPPQNIVEKVSKTIGRLQRTGNLRVIILTLVYCSFLRAHSIAEGAVPAPVPDLPTDQAQAGFHCNLSDKSQNPRSGF